MTGDYVRSYDCYVGYTAAFFLNPYRSIIYCIYIYTYKHWKVTQNTFDQTYPPLYKFMYLYIYMWTCIPSYLHNLNLLLYRTTRCARKQRFSIHGVPPIYAVFKRPPWLWIMTCRCLGISPWLDPLCKLLKLQLSRAWFEAATSGVS